MLAECSQCSDPRRQPKHHRSMFFHGLSTRDRKDGSSSHENHSTSLPSFSRLMDLPPKLYQPWARDCDPDSLLRSGTPSPEPHHYHRRTQPSSFELLVATWIQNAVLLPR